MRWYSRDIETDAEPGEVHRFHVTPDPEAGGYTGWVRECVRACLGQRDAPISNAHSARAVGAFLPRPRPRSRPASEPSDACGARV